MNAPVDSGALIVRAQAGNRETFGESVSRYGGLVYGLCRDMAGSSWDAQDLAHDAFVEAWLKLPSLRDPHRFAAWLRTLLNVCRMWHRRRRRKREGLEQVNDTAAADGDAAAGEGRGTLFDGLSQLSADHRLRPRPALLGRPVVRGNGCLPRRTRRHGDEPNAQGAGRVKEKDRGNVARR